jgi:hypothetical protein
VSTPLTPADLTASLVQRQVLPPGTQSPSTMQAHRPWFIGVVVGAAGWLAGIFGMAFVWMLFEPSSTGAFVLIACVLLGAAYGLYAVDRESAFFDQLALALSIAGQISAVVAASKFTSSAAAVAAIVALLQCVLALVMPNALARTLATLFACIAWALTIRLAWWDEDLFDTRKEVALGPAVTGWCVIWLPVMALAWQLIERESAWMATGMRQVIRPVLTGLLVSIALGTTFSAPAGVFDVWQPSVERETNWLSMWPLLDVFAALVAALFAFRVRSTALVGTAIAAALIHVMQFYFLLGTTLLAKSFIMLGVGVLLLVGGLLLRKRLVEVA